MQHPPIPGENTSQSRCGAVRNILLEAAVVAVVGVALAFAANALSPRGLDLRHDNFPPRPSVASLWPANKGVAATGTNQVGFEQNLAERLRAEGLQLGQSNAVMSLFQDPRFAQDLVVFIDARDDRAYQSGHIPGAYQFDRYYPEKYVATMLQVCGPAQQIVVYCNGGNCEDSEFAALMLSQWGVPKSKLLVYGGGITEWTSNRWPVELGARHSGQLHHY